MKLHTYVGHTNPPKPRVNSLHVSTCMSVGRMTSLGGKDEGYSNINSSRGRSFYGRQTDEYHGSREVFLRKMNVVKVIHVNCQLSPQQWFNKNYDAILAVSRTQPIAALVGSLSHTALFHYTAPSLICQKTGI